MPNSERSNPTKYTVSMPHVQGDNRDMFRWYCSTKAEALLLRDTLTKMRYDVTAFVTDTGEEIEP